MKIRRLLSFMCLSTLLFSTLPPASGNARPADRLDAALALALGPVAHDYNGDGASDLFWRNESNGSLAIWYSANAATSVSLGAVTDLQWQVVGDGDFNGDGKTDILWRHATSGANAIWYSGNPATRVNLATVTDTRWQVVATGDFDGDGASDILWNHYYTRAATIWKRGNYATQQAVATVSDSTWEIVGAGDFNGDGVSDIFWKNRSVLRLVIWLSADVSTVRNLPAVRSNWSYQGIGDFNADGKSDILWHGNLEEQQMVYWPGGDRDASVIASRSRYWLWGDPAFIGDYDGDLVSDVLARQLNSTVWTHNVWYGARMGSGPRLPTVDRYWRVLPKSVPRYW